MPARKNIVLATLKKKLRSRLPYLKLSDREFLGTVYREILGRAIDVDGLTVCSRLLREGRTRWEIILLLIRSEEFAAKTVRDQTALDSDRAPARKAFYVFSKEGKAHKHREICEAVRRVHLPAPGGRP